MYLFKSLILFIMISFSFSSVFENIVWWDGYMNGKEIGRSVIETEDNQYYVVAGTYGSGPYMSKFERNGDMVCEYIGAGEQYTDENDNGQYESGEPWIDFDGDGFYDSGGIFKELIHSIRETSNGEFVMLGQGQQWEDTDNDGDLDLSTHERMRLFKLDSNCNLQWSKIIDTSNDWEDDGYGQSIDVTEDGGYILFTYSGPNGSSSQQSVYLIKVDNNGNEEWRQSHTIEDQGTSDSNTTVFSGLVANDGSLVWIGGIGTDPLNGIPEKYYIRKANSNGTIIWTQYYDDIRLNSLDKTYDGGYVVLGTKGGDGEGQLSLTKVDANGTTVWSNEYDSGSSGTHAGYSVDEALDGGFIMAGYRFTNLGIEGDMQIWIQKVDIDGTPEWDNGQSYPSYNPSWGNSSYWDWAYSVKATSECGYIFTGYTIQDTNMFGADNNTGHDSNNREDLYIVNTNNAGETNDSLCDGEYDCVCTCDGSAIIQTYYYDNDGDSLGSDIQKDFCSGLLPPKWVLNSDDLDDDCYSNIHDCASVCDGPGSTETKDGSCCTSGVIDECGFCDGDGETFTCCDESIACMELNDESGYSFCTVITDSCGLCGGDGDKTYYLDTDGDGLGDPSNSFTGCTIPEDGNDYVLDNTDADPNCATNDTDSCGICAGPGAIYECGCSDITNGACDCDGNILDECSVCGGSGIPEGECDCDGNTLDCSGACGGSGIPEGECDCDGNTLDCSGACGGDAILDDMGICCSLSEGCNSCECASNENILFPKEFEISNAYPNPFNPITNIIYGIPEFSEIRIIIYDLSGKQIQTLVNGYQNPGYHSISWNAGNHPSAIYLVKILADEYTNTKKLMLVK